MTFGWYVKYPIAHRGLHSEKLPPETREAFQNAIRSGFPFEFDVQILYDGNILVSNEPRLEKKWLNRLSTDDIIDYNKKNIVKKVFLSDLLQFTSGDVPIMMELKNFGAPGVLEHEIGKIMDKYKGEFTVCSSNPYSLEFFKNRYPGFIRGQIALDMKRENQTKKEDRKLKNLEYNYISEPHYISYNINDLPNKHVEIERKKGIPILGWTIKTRDDLSKSLKYCDNYIFENIEIPKSQPRCLPDRSKP